MNPALQEPLFAPRLPAPAKGPPAVEARTDLSEQEVSLLRQARLDDIAPVEAWTIAATNKQLHYATHGIFRFFGKFPPPIAGRLIAKYTGAGDLVLDPMVGSGTTAVEAALAGRRAEVSDVSPLSVLLTRVKTSRVDRHEAHEALARVRLRYRTGEAVTVPTLTGLRNPEHWFLPETLQSLARIKAAIDLEASGAERDLLTIAFLWTVRRASRATTQQGRLFLDVTTALPEAWEEFEARAETATKAASSIPASWGASVSVRLEPAQGAESEAPSGEQVPLCVLHPPYFNNYKYSGVNSLELSWLGVDHNQIRKGEVREFFKVGGADNAPKYVADMAKVFAKVASRLAPGGRLGLMVGDSVFRGEYLPVTRGLVAEAVALGLTPELVALRVPQFTEASWVASQRRTGDKVGISLCDFVVVLRRA